MSRCHCMALKRWTGQVMHTAEKHAEYGPSLAERAFPLWLAYQRSLTHPAAAPRLQHQTGPDRPERR